MKYLEEFRDPELAQRLFDEIRRKATRPWALMEVCGGQTHSIIRNGIDQLLPQAIELIHGPGCPVCVTPLETIDRALAIAAQPGVIFCSFGDMLRVPGSDKDLFRVKSEGGDVRIVYSPLDALALARANPDKQVVFLAIGFETTAPANAMAVFQAKQQGIRNFSMLVSHVLVPPAIEAILSSPANRVQAFLAAGHVCSVMGTWQYEPLAERYGVPIVVTGFEPLDILEGIRRAVEQLEAGQAEVDNAYARAVSRERQRPGPERCCKTSSWYAIAPGAASARFPTAAGSSARSMLSSMQPNASPSNTSKPRNRPIVTAARSCKACSSPTNARPSAPCARPPSPSARPWSPAKAPARRISGIDGRLVDIGR